MRSTLLALPLFSLVACLAATARAQSVDETEARADTLFHEGQSLLTAGQTAAGCAKLEESQRIDPRLGRLLNVAYCHEQLGRTATAWAEYNQAAALAVQSKQADRESFARGRASSLAGKLSFVQLDLAAVPEVAEMKVDGAALPRDQWTLPFPVDPGKHTLSVAAPGRKTHDQMVVASEPGTQRVSIAPLAPEAIAPEPVGPGPAPVPAAAPENAERSSAPWRTVGWVLGGAGVVGLGVGATFGLVALVDKNGAGCTSSNVCRPGTTGAIKTNSLVSDVGWVAGGVLLAGGLVVLLLSPGGDHEPGSALRLAPVFAGHACGLVAEGSF